MVHITSMQKVSIGFVSAISGIILHKPIVERLSHFLYVHHQNFQIKQLPKRIILVRHGQSEGNVDSSIYGKLADNKINLTEKGKKQALQAGKELKKMLKNESITFYVSPYKRTLQTYENIIKSLTNNNIQTFIDSRIREQEYGNMYSITKEIQKVRNHVGRFYYRFLHGESGADCYQRVNSFLEKMYKDFKNCKIKSDNVVIVCHGIVMRVFAMIMLGLPIEKYQKLVLPGNCKFWIFEKNKNGDYQINRPLKYLH